MSINIVEPNFYCVETSGVLETVIDGEFVGGGCDRDLDDLFKALHQGEEDGTTVVTAAVMIPLSEPMPLPTRDIAALMAPSLTPMKKPKSRHEVPNGVSRIKRSIIKRLPARHAASDMKARATRVRTSKPQKRVRSIQSRVTDRERRLRKRRKYQDTFKLWFQLERALQSLLEPLIHLAECGLWPHPRLSPQQLVNMYNQSLCAAYTGGSYATGESKMKINKSLKMANTL